MRKIKKTMGMTAVIEINDKHCKDEDFEDVFTYFENIDEVFSPFKETSIISKFNKGKILKKDLGSEVLKILKLSEVTKEANKRIL